MLETAMAHYRQQRVAIAAAMAAARRASDVDRLHSVVLAAQLGLVSNAFDAVPEMLAEQDIRSEPLAELEAAALIGVASDGRPLRSLLELIETDRQFDLIVKTQLQDVARTGQAVARTVQRNVTHYVRALQLPSCGRCVVLAGKPSRSEKAFDRHPKCDCISVPTNERVAGRIAIDPADAFARMSAAEQAKAFTVAGAESIRLGADPSRVMNARRGMATAQVNPIGWRPQGRAIRKDVFGHELHTTTELVSHRRAGVRLMPESILEIANEKADAVRLLKLYGYVL